MSTKARIIVTPKKSVLDPQGEAVRHAVRALGLEKARSVRVGKYIEIELEDAPSSGLRSKLESVCHDLLSNPVIEDYELELPSDTSLSSGQAQETRKLLTKKLKKALKKAKKAQKKALKKILKAAKNKSKKKKSGGKRRK
jgi:phosphoribosylformylglycinamidine synthase